ncbi:hypothetical protein [Butyrivibrio sp. YAB3001]|uniref:hypothetical protein n=1 Tax=Butyrivibrio sp. YAB3001 TaxID=1520812 RepID=UPI0008F6454F|nr:hypothetical protein [Butyrivibrio sp. YAB3001]SFB86979.1 hypothetical protein SAMN02910398_00938 [Butyrivibrio sp. YAB3001]
MANEVLKMALKESGVKQWELAKKCGYSSNYFCAKLREELPEKEKMKLFAFIQEIEEEKESKK